jgi:hypothetical protein
MRQMLQLSAMEFKVTIVINLKLMKTLDSRRNMVTNASMKLWLSRRETPKHNSDVDVTEAARTG